MNLGFDIYSLAVKKAVGWHVTCHIKVLNYYFLQNVNRINRL